MAKTMGAGTPAKRGRGRPPGSGKKAGAEASAASEQAPGLGHNTPDEGIFFAWLQRLNAQDAKVAAAKALVKVEVGIRRDLRKTAGGAGLVMGELDDALEDMRTEKVDLEAKEERRRLYRTWLGLPVGGQQEAKVHVSDPSFQKNLWVKKARAAGALGEDIKWDEVPGDLMQDTLAAYSEGQAVVAKASKLLGPAFAGEDRQVPTAEEVKAAKEANPDAKPAAAPPPVPAKVLVLDGNAFPGVTDVDDANLKTLHESKREAWAHADTVMVIIDSKKRILKEPAAGADGPYEDTGEDGVPLSEVEDAAPEEVEALAEAPADEPEAEPALVGTAPAEAAAQEEPNWAELDDDPELWFASAKASVRAWIIANPDAILKHPGAIKLAEAMAAADRADTPSDGAAAADFE